MAKSWFANVPKNPHAEEARGLSVPSHVRGTVHKMLVGTLRDLHFQPFLLLIT
jgi:hypothetical protein